MRQAGRPATPSATAAAVPAPGTAAASPAATPHTSLAGAVAAAGAEPLLEPLFLLSSADAAACNVLELTPLSASPLPPKLAAAVHAANGALGCTLGLHLPGGGRTLAVQCGGGSLAANEQQLVWRRGCRVHLPPSSTQALKAGGAPARAAAHACRSSRAGAGVLPPPSAAHHTLPLLPSRACCAPCCPTPHHQEHIELGQPLLLEVARYLQPPAADTSADPAFGSYHALLALSCAVEQLSEPGGVLAAGPAVPLGCMSHMLQQGKVAAAGLPAYTPPSAVG